MGRGQIIVAGNKYGRLTAIEFSHVGPRQLRYWRFRCECGGDAVLQASRVAKGRSKSCGCLKNFSGENNPMYRGGKSRTAEHRVWSGMIDRCTKPRRSDYPRYGGRGISVCARWMESFESFLADMGPRPLNHEIDRINNDGNYEPSNCRWATRSSQVRNRSNTLRVNIDGYDIPLAEACEKVGLSYDTVFYRIKSGWPTDRIFEDPR